MVINRLHTHIVHTSTLACAHGYRCIVLKFAYTLVFYVETFKSPFLYLSKFEDIVKVN